MHANLTASTTETDTEDEEDVLDEYDAKTRNL